MKFLKKAFTLSLAALLVGSVGYTAARAEGDTPKGDDTPEVIATNTTVNVTVNGNTHSQFEYYQIFSAKGQANTEDDQPLTNIDWGKDVTDADKAEIIKAVNGILELTGSAAVPETASAQDVAAALSTMKSDEMVDDELSHSPKAIHLARALYAIMSNRAGNPLSAGKNKVEIGYYLIVDKSTLSTTSNDALNAALLQLTRDITVTTKTDAPAKVEKHIIVDGKEADANAASVGDTVNYRINSKVPDLTYFTTYMFAIADDLSDGLQLVKPADASISPFKVTVGAATLTYGVDYTVEYGTKDPDDFIITFITMKERFDDTSAANFTAGANIVVEYAATVLDTALIGNPGNPNDVKLYYQNDPNWYAPIDPSTGKPVIDPKTGEPYTPKDPATPLGPNNPDDPDTPIEKNPDNPVYPTDPNGNPVLPGYVSNSPWDRVITYVAELVIEKVDGDGKPLEDATFNLSGTAITTVLGGGKYYAKVEEGKGTYYKLKNGQYTEDDPIMSGDQSNAALYDTTTKDYDVVEYTGVAKNTETVSYDATTDANGIAIYAGLNEGEYTLKETKAPLHYNIIEDDASLVITCHVSDSVNYDDPSTWNATWNYVVSGGVNTTGTTTDGQVIVKVVNRKGTPLPETGGIGTTLFYVIGGILAVGAGVLLVAKKRVA